MSIDQITQCIHAAQNAPTHTLAAIILDNAFRLRASDIHFCPYTATHIDILFRIDGLMVRIYTLDSNRYLSILVHLKAIANIDITITHLPQDGRFTLTDSETHCRINLCPTIFGQRAVIRMIAEHTHTDLAQLGLTPQHIDVIEKALAKKQGLILTVGPTGSGKTVTLYSLLHHISQQNQVVLTACDPVEIYQQHINQTNLAPQLGLDYSTLIKNFLRQDPDAMMLGEIRDRDTLHSAIEAATTGHQVLSSIHTASTFSTWSRIVHLGADPDTIPNWLNLVIAQRLLRRICTFCYKQQPQCPHCLAGYRGVVAVFALRSGIEIAETADHMHTDQPDFMTQAHHWIAQGVTDMDEVERVLSA